MQGEIPGLVIENCSSGGHRLEPSMMALASMASFSDAHECPEIPIIAANLHRMILPRQSQIWAVLRSKDTLQRTCYSLAATFLGRMCISGDIGELPEPNWKAMTEAISLYETVADVIGIGVSTWYGTEIKSYRHPKGWQAILRTKPDHSAAILVFHSFSNPIPHEITVKLPPGNWHCAKTLTAGHLCARIENDAVHVTGAREYEASVLYLTAACGSVE